VTPDDLKIALAKAVNPQLAEQLVNEFVAFEEAFLLKRWKYSELDGGRFTEVAARIIYVVDSSNVSRTKPVDDCFRYIDNEQVPHAYPERQGAIHLVKVLRAIYKLRSQRGAVHVSPTYTANEIDSRLILESVRWVLADLLRVFVTTDREMVANIVRDLARFPHPLIRNIEDEPLLQSVTFTTEEEVLAHLLHAGNGLATATLVKFIPKSASGVRAALSNLSTAKSRQIANRSSKWFITDLGIKRIEERIARESGK
jgi:hypothetical protein